MLKRELPVARYPRHRPSTSVIVFSYGLATTLVVMVTAQLMTYDKFAPILQNYQIGDAAITKLLAAAIVISSVLALPFLMRMSLSPLLRIVSALCLMVVSSLWFMVGAWDISHNPPTVGSGILGGVGQGIIPSEATLLVGSLLIVWSGFVIVLLRKDIVS